MILGSIRAHARVTYVELSTIQNNSCANTRTRSNGQRIYCQTRPTNDVVQKHRCYNREKNRCASCCP